MLTGLSSCNNENEKIVPVPVITATAADYSLSEEDVSVNGAVINIQVPAIDLNGKTTNLAGLKISFAVKHGILKDYDNNAYHDFSQPFVIHIMDYMYHTMDYTVNVGIRTHGNPDFVMKGLSIAGITLADADVAISGANIQVKVPTLKDNFSATDYRNLPVFYNIENGVTAGFTNGAGMNYSTGLDVSFKDYSGNTIVYHVAIEQAYVDKGPQIDPVLTFKAINLNWQKVTTETLPAGLELYTVNDFKPGSTTEKTSGDYARLDLSSSSQCRLGVGYTGGVVQNIKKWYANASDPKPAIITNAGFFGGSASYSLIIENSQIKFQNTGSLSRPLNGTSASYSPTRSAFGIMPDGTAEVAWVYNSGGKTYSFDTPVRNAMNYEPLPGPMDNAFAAIRKEWNPVLALGGAPVLIKDDKIVLTQTAEFCDQFQGNRSRTAIGVTATNHILLLVLDETPSPVKGWSLTDLAMIMKTLGCKHALNLDGGGSTAMVVNGVIKNTPSDTSSEGDSRAIPTVVLIKQK
jgi:hypothetical protein